MKYFEVQVDIKVESETKGGGTKVKTVKENYLVDAMSVTEAEARIVKLFVESGYSQDYEVTGAKGSKIIQVVERDDKKLKKVGQRLKSEQEEIEKRSDLLDDGNNSGDDVDDPNAD